jgi:hypothetical protein
MEYQFEKEVLGKGYREKGYGKQITDLIIDSMLCLKLIMDWLACTFRITYLADLAVMTQYVLA